MPQYAVICKLQKQGNGWYNLVQDCRPENYKHQCLQAGEDGCPSSRRQKERLPFICLFVLLGPSVEEVMPVHIDEGRPS